MKSPRQDPLDTTIQLLFTKSMKRPLILGLVVIILISALAAGLFLVSQSSKQKAPPKAPEFASTSKTPASWPTYTSQAFKYTISYPPEFKIEPRGKVGGLDDLVAFNYQANGKSLTIVKIQIQTGLKNAPSTQAGQDGNGNQVLVFNYPYKESKTLSLIGTVYPTIGSPLRFEAAIKQMAQSLKI